MKYKQKVDLITAIILILIGLVILILPIINILNIKYMLIVILALYAALNLAQYLLTKDSKDYEGVQTFLASALGVVACTIIDIAESPGNLAMVLMLWIIIMSLCKLKKVDYYHDRKDRMWIIHLVTLILFIIAGLLTSFNLAYTKETQTLIIGYFMLTNGILEIFDPIVKTLLDKK